MKKKKDKRFSQYAKRADLLSDHINEFTHALQKYLINNC